MTIKQCTPEQAGIPSECILNFIKRLEKNQIPMHSFLLLRHDFLIAEGYYAPYTADTLHRMFSISKSFTSIAIGLLADEGKLSLTDSVADYFPDKLPKNPHPWILSMTIQNLLMMRTCHASTTYRLNMESDWVESFFSTPPTHPAGKLFHYDTSAAHTLAALVERLSGMPLLDYLKKKLSPLHLSAASYMLRDPFGVSMGGTGLVATPMDLLKFGYFIFHEGNVNGQQLISADYIRTAVSCLSDTRMTAPVRSEACGYGYQFWQNEKNGYVCYGMGGQLIIFLPEYDMICVTTADTQGIGGGNQCIYDALYEEILPFVHGDFLPEHVKSHDRLLSVLNNLQIAPLEGTIFSSDADMLSGKKYTLLPNAMGFTELTLEFSDTASPANTAGAGNRAQCGTLSFSLKGKAYQFSFGMGQLVTGIFPVYDLKYAASGIWLSEHMLYIKVHIIDAYVGSVHFELSFGDDDVTVFMKKQEESFFQEFQGHLYGKYTP